MAERPRMSPEELAHFKEVMARMKVGWQTATATRLASHSPDPNLRDFQVFDGVEALAGGGMREEESSLRRWKRRLSSVEDWLKVRDAS